jgi:hypothetical protein
MVDCTIIISVLSNYFVGILAARVVILIFRI